MDLQEFDLEISAILLPYQQHGTVAMLVRNLVAQPKESVQKADLQSFMPVVC